MEETINLTKDEAILKGHCIIISKEGKLSFVGPLGHPRAEQVDEDLVVILNPEDFNLFREQYRNRKKLKGDI